jgi:hypothetical protein
MRKSRFLGDANTYRRYFMHSIKFHVLWERTLEMYTSANAIHSYKMYNWHKTNVSSVNCKKSFWQIQYMQLVWVFTRPNSFHYRQLKWCGFFYFGETDQCWLLSCHESIARKTNSSLMFSTLSQWITIKVNFWNKIGDRERMLEILEFQIISCICK